MKRRPSRLSWEAGIGVLENDVVRQQHGEPFVERRRAPRVSLSVPIHFKQKGKIFGWETGKSVDVSRYGIRLSSVSPKIKIGTRLVLEVKLPETKKLFKLDGVVVWTRPKGDISPTVECGVSFENPKHVSHLGRVLYFLTDKLCQFALQQSKHLDAYPANSAEEIKDAYRLVYDQYVCKGYCPEDASKIFYTHFCVFPESQTFLLREKGRLLGTLTLIPDSSCGLPMESVFSEEIRRIRLGNKKIAEVSLLALDLQSFEKKSFALTDYAKLSAAFKLFKTMFDYARFELKVTDLVITMHPRHQGLYQYLRFETIGQIRSYSGACGKPALPMHLNIERVVNHTPVNRGAGSYFLTSSIPKEVWQKHFTWDRESAREFLIRLRPLWPEIPPDHQCHLKRWYPEISS